MPFFDRSKIFPKPQNKIKLQEFDNNDKFHANQQGIDGSGDYAVNKAAVLCFLIDDDADELYKLSNRLVSFKGFIEELSINMNVGYEDDERFSLPVIAKYLKEFKFTYSLSFNVISHTVNDATSNMARFSELERILSHPYGTNSNPGSANKDLLIPNAYVFLSNLINNGMLNLNNKYKSIKITNSFVRENGIRAAVKNLKMEPDLEMGFFEFNNQVLFKSFKVTMEIPVTNDIFQKSYKDEVANPSTGYKMIMPYVRCVDADASYYYYDLKGVEAFGSLSYGEVDSGGFPFCVPWSYSKVNTSYAQAQQAYGQNKKTKLGICINDNNLNKDLSKNKYITKSYCVFDAFLDSFSYERNQSADAKTRGTDVMSNSFKFTDAGHVLYNFSINIPSYSVVDAEANCMKINSLIRMLPINSNQTLDSGASVKILLGNLIKAPEARGSTGFYNFSDIYKNGLTCFILSMNLSIDLDMGFFEYNQYFLPKAMKLDFQVMLNNNLTGKPIYQQITEEATIEKRLDNDNDDVRWPFGIKYDNVKKD
jgi:hypothetical protein